VSGLSVKKPDTFFTVISQSKSVQKRLSQYRDALNERTTAVFRDRKPNSLYDPVRYVVSSGGKQLRPVLLLACCEAVGGDFRSLLDVAVALECVHNFTLVHDDIMDEDDLRRGRQTVHKKWNENTAILTGDALLVKAFELLSSVEERKMPYMIGEFSSGILEICEGQVLDKEFEKRETVSVEEYYDMIAKKTGRLFSLSCQLGAYLGDGSAEQIKALEQYGNRIGFAFQIQDDVLDLISRDDVLGKNIGSDLRGGKKTFLVSYALDHLHAEELQLFNSILALKSPAKSDFEQFIQLCKKSGTFDAAETEIQQALAAARRNLSLIKTSVAKDILIALLDQIETRTF
jgi:geranylgeranyl pyrophosphate synthase